MDALGTANQYIEDGIGQEISGRCGEAKKGSSRIET
jgi:hypothetical protein